MAHRASISEHRACAQREREMNNHTHMHACTHAHTRFNVFTTSAGVCGIVAWAVWLGWQNAMNDDVGRTEGLVTFSTLDSGPAFGLTVAASVFNFVAACACVCVG